MILCSPHSFTLRQTTLPLAAILGSNDYTRMTAAPIARLRNHTIQAIDTDSVYQLGFHFQSIRRIKNRR